MYWILGLDTSDGCPWKIPVSATPWLRTPVDWTFAAAAGTLVAWGSGVGLPGTAVAAAFAGAFAGAEVAAGALAAGADVGAGVAVAEDPQANNRATNNRTIALGQCFMIFLPDLDSDILPSPNLRFVMMFPKLQISSPEEIS
jgi:hypothetical protein